MLIILATGNQTVSGLIIVSRPSFEPGYLEAFGYDSHDYEIRFYTEIRFVIFIQKCLSATVGIL